MSGSFLLNQGVEFFGKPGSESFLAFAEPRETIVVRTTRMHDAGYR